MRASMSTVVLVVLALAAGLAVGYARRGRLRRLASPPPARNRLLLTALGLYVLGVFASWAWESALPVLSALSWFVIAHYAWLNRWMPGARLVAFGVAANAVVLLFNGSIPVEPDAAARAGLDSSAITSTGNAVPADDSTRLNWLTKNIPVAFPPHPEVISPGDIAVASGLATVVATGMVGRRPASNVVPSRRRDRDSDDLDDELGDDDAGPAGDTRADDTGARPRGAAHATMKRRSRGDTAPIGPRATA